jgi:DNA-binding LacI/PurR family transcriptional regulator
MREWLMVTIKDVSKKSGFSVTTVSKVINDYPDISSKTKKIILELCDEMGYIPNLSARSLISKKSYTVGVIYEETTGVGLQHPLFSKILKSFKDEIEKEGYDLLFLSKNIMKRNDSYLQHTKRKQVDGVLVLCAEFDSEKMNEMYRSETPQVVIDFDTSNALTVTSNNYSGVEKAIDYLYSLGHRKIAHICGGRNTYVGGQRIEQYEKSLAKLNLELKDDYVVDGPDFTRQQGYEAMQKLIYLDDRPTAVFCSSDMLAIGAIKAIKDASLSVPEDFSIVGFDGIDLGQLITPRLTSVRQDASQMGIIAAKNVIEMINENKKKNIGESIRIDCDLMIGESTRAI